MGLFDLFKKKPAAVPDAPPELPVYPGMRVETTGFDGQLLFVAKLTNLQGDRAELRQYSPANLAEDQEPLRVRVRGYNDRERKAVYLEGVISLQSERIWRVEGLTVTRVENDRAFFRLDTNLKAAVTTFSGPDAGERPCRLLNISVGGARIQSEYPYQKGDKFLLTARLLEDREPCAVYCQVLRVIEHEDTGNEYGCQFLELSEADQDRITENIFAAQRLKRNGGAR